MSAEDHRIERRLAAIFAADAAGYSRLMNIDETGTLRVLTAHRVIMDRLIAEHRGRIANTAGDSVLAEFPSAVDAVQCAMEVQTQLANAPNHVDLRFRIGIHVGDVIVQGGDLLGDSVNLAARLEALAEPGGICLSEGAYEHARKALPLNVVDIGPQKVKNIAGTLRAYLVRSGAATVPPYSPSALPLPEKPSIAVLPFKNISGDPEQEYFADGIAEDLLTNLARLSWLFVIARNSSFAFRGKEASISEIADRLGVRYVLEGSVRRAGNKVRVGAQLIVAATGVQLWGDRYDRELIDIFELQDEINQNVIAAIEPTLRKAEIDRVKRKRPDDMDAYDLYLRALAHMFEVKSESRALALGFIARALQIAPDYAEAHGVAAWCYFAKSLWEGGMPEAYSEAMLRHGRAVQSLQTEDASTLAHAAIALALATRDYAGALEMIDRAIALNPNSAHAHGHGSVINTWAGNYDRSIELSGRALRLSPFDPLSVMPLAGQAGAHLMKGDYDNAFAYARRALQIYPTHTPSFLISIVSLVRLGRKDEASAMGLQLLAASPSYRILPRAPVLEHFVAELREAGLPG